MCVCRRTAKADDCTGKNTNAILEMIAAITIKKIAVSRISFAESSFFSPLLRATKAEIATFKAKTGQVLTVLAVW